MALESRPVKRGDGNLRPFSSPNGTPSATAKRWFDVIAGLALCVAALPMMTVFACLLALHLRTWPFFVHERIGAGGRLIPIPKLRTLGSDHDRYADKTAVALTPPSRLTAFLRRSHLDELPQLLLVPIGRLSLVGPRPRMVSEAEACDDDVYNVVRTTVPQGCTGLWQVSTGTTARVSDHPEYDLFYVQQRTLRLDVWIVWRTAIQTLGALAGPHRGRPSVGAARAFAGRAGRNCLT